MTVAAQQSKSMLIIIRHSPYGSSLARASLDTAMASAAFEQPVQLLFLGDGVLQLHADQDGHAMGQKNIARQLASLPLYDIETVFVDAEAAQQYRMDLNAAPVPARALSRGEIQKLMNDCDHLLGF